MTNIIRLKGDDMSIFKKLGRKSMLEEQIDARVEQLSLTISDTDEDAKEIKNIKDLVECKTELEGHKFELNWNTVISGLFGIFGIALLISHERDGVLSSQVSRVIPVSKFFK